MDCGGRRRMWAEAVAGPLRLVPLSTLPKKRRRLKLVHWTVWFLVVCLSIALGGVFCYHNWSGWEHLLSQWIGVLATAGILVLAFILIPASLKYVSDKWERKPEWLRDDDYVPWKAKVGTAAFIALWIYGLCLFGFLLWTCFSDDRPPVQDGAALDGVTENRARNLGQWVHDTPGGACHGVVMAEKVSKNIYLIGCSYEPLNENHLYEVRVDDDGFHWPAKRVFIDELMRGSKAR